MKRKPRKTAQRKRKRARKPAIPGAGRGGVVPPIETRFVAGQSGNPAGRPSAGASLIEWVNVLAARQLNEIELRKIATNWRTQSLERAAAIRLLHMLEYGDLADMTAAIEKGMTLEELRDAGVNTAVIRKLKTRTRTITQEDGKEHTEVERDIELHDRGGDEFDRICDRTAGRPTQAVKLSGAVQMIKRVILVKSDDGAKS